MEASLRSAWGLGPGHGPLARRIHHFLHTVQNMNMEASLRSPYSWGKSGGNLREILVNPGEIQGVNGEIHSFRRCCRVGKPSTVGGKKSDR